MPSCRPNRIGRLPCILLPVDTIYPSKRMASNDQPPLPSETTETPSVSKAMRFYYRHREEILEKQRQRYRESELYKQRQEAKDAARKEREEAKRKREEAQREERRQKAASKAAIRASEKAMRLGITPSSKPPPG